MKTTKFFLIVALLAYAALSYSQPEPVKTPYTIKISFERAMQKPGLVLAMRQQLKCKFNKFHQWRACAGVFLWVCNLQKPEVLHLRNLKRMESIF